MRDRKKMPFHLLHPYRTVMKSVAHDYVKKNIERHQKKHHSENFAQNAVYPHEKLFNFDQHTSTPAAFPSVCACQVVNFSEKNPDKQ